MQVQSPTTPLSSLRSLTTPMSPSLSRSPLLRTSMSSPSLRMASSGSMDPLAGGRLAGSSTSPQQQQGPHSPRAVLLRPATRVGWQEAKLGFVTTMPRGLKPVKEPKRPPATSQGLMGRRVHERSMDGLPAAVMRVSTTTGDRTRWSSSRGPQVGGRVSWMVSVGAERPY